MNCIIVDDEPLAQSILVSYVKQVTQLNLVAVCHNSMEAMEALHNFDIDLMFVDIKMPVISGIEMVKTLANKPIIILTTAFSEYAVESYEIGVHDYLLKPISFERFLKSINKILNNNQFESVDFTKGFASADSFVFFKSDKKTFKLYHKDILFFEGYGNYVRVHTKSNKPILILEKLTTIEENFNGLEFIRVHKSFIISLRNIDEVEGNIIRISQHLVPISQSYRDKFQQALNFK